jgi:hypothetical protein
MKSSKKSLLLVLCKKKLIVFTSLSQVKSVDSSLSLIEMKLSYINEDDALVMDENRRKLHYLGSLGK